jgi:hypothetical protein
MVTVYQRILIREITLAAAVKEDTTGKGVFSV